MTYVYSIRANDKIKNSLTNWIKEIEKQLLPLPAGVAGTAGGGGGDFGMCYCWPCRSGNAAIFLCSPQLSRSMLLLFSSSRYGVWSIYSAYQRTDRPSVRCQWCRQTEQIYFWLKANISEIYNGDDDDSLLLSIFF